MEFAYNFVQFSHKLNTMAKSTIFWETGTSEVLWDCLNSGMYRHFYIHLSPQTLANRKDNANLQSYNFMEGLTYLLNIMVFCRETNCIY